MSICSLKGCLKLKRGFVTPPAELRWLTFAEPQPGSAERESSRIAVMSWELRMGYTVKNTEADAPGELRWRVIEAALCCSVFRSSCSTVAKASAEVLRD